MVYRARASIRFTECTGLLGLYKVYRARVL